ncbi:unnamed protein product, partial [Coregonus sp. 'balchen']
DQHQHIISGQKKKNKTFVKLSLSPTCQSRIFCWCRVCVKPQALTQPQLDPNPEKASPAGQAFPHLSLDGSPLSHLLLDPRSGHLYVGAVLSSSQTGPKLDSPECLPPIVPKDCPTARVTPNTNKILLLEEAGSEVRARSLIVCGTLFQGICDKRSLGNVSEVLYQTSNPVDTQYVAANDPRVSTVGVILNQNGVGLMLVGRGYTSKGPSDIPPITTRRLSPSTSPARQAFSQDEELGKLVVGSYSEYNNNFISAFNHSDHVYFLFSRRDMWHRKEYRTYVSRLCAGDRSFYSYVEVPLECSGGYNLAQGASSGEHQGQPALFVAMAAGQASTPAATGRSALCVYGMSEMDAALQRAQELCYTEGGTGSTGQQEAYIEYEVSSKCLRLPKSSLTQSLQSSLTQSLQSSLTQSLQSSLTQSLQSSLTQSLQSSLTQSLQSSLTQSLQSSLTQSLQSSLTQSLQSSLTQSLQSSLTQSLQSSLTQSLQSSLTPKPAVIPDPKPAVIPDPKPAVIPDPKPAVIPDPKPAVIPDPKPAVIPDPKPAVIPDPKPAVIPDPKPAVIPDPKPAVIPDPKPAVIPDPKPAVHP